MKLKEQAIYRVAYNATPREIAGKPAIFLGYVDRWYDVTRARVVIGGVTWLVRPSLLIAQLS